MVNALAYADCTLCKKLFLSWLPKHAELLPWYCRTGSQLEALQTGLVNLVTLMTYSDFPSDPSDEPVT